MDGYILLHNISFNVFFFPSSICSYRLITKHHQKSVGFIKIQTWGVFRKCRCGFSIVCVLIVLSGNDFIQNFPNGKLLWCCLVLRAHFQKGNVSKYCTWHLMIFFGLECYSRFTCVIPLLGPLSYSAWIPRGTWHPSGTHGRPCTHPGKTACSLRVMLWWHNV